MTNAPTDFRSGFDLLNDAMQAGYAIFKDNPCQACEHWLEGWSVFLRVFDHGNYSCIALFDEEFDGLQSVYNWVQDFETEMSNAALSSPI